METTNQNGHIVHASQVINEQGALTLGVLPFDLGMSKLAHAEKNTIILADGRLIKLTGTDEDIQLIAADRGMRVKQTLIHLYLSGLNLATARDYFVEAYGSQKEFWEKMTKETGFSKAKLENEIKISQGFTQDEIEKLAESGATQSIAVRLLKASSAKKEEVLNEIKEGLTPTNAVIDELLAEDDKNEDKEKEESETTASNSNKAFVKSENKVSGDLGKQIEKPASEACVDVAGSFQSYTNLVKNTGDYTPQYIALEERLNAVLEEVERNRTKHELKTVRGLSLRCGMANVLARYYGITLPSEAEGENEPQWMTELRDKLPKRQNREFTSNFVMAFVEGHLGAIKSESEVPNYEALLINKLMSKEAIECLYDIWAVGFAQGKLGVEATTNN